MRDEKCQEAAENVVSEKIHFYRISDFRRSAMPFLVQKEKIERVYRLNVS